MAGKKRYVVALAGNPNVGKTVVFNELTGMRQHVGNWPGVTVERKTGELVYKGLEMEIVDLPGTYSLNPYSLDEKITRRYIIEERPDAVVNIVDASNIERNLYLTVQLLEAGANVVLALNMMDEAEKRGMKIDTDRLGEILKVPVVKMVAPKGVGFKELKEAIYEEVTRHREHRHMSIGYGEAEKFIIPLEDEIKACEPLKNHSPRWVAIKLLENDEYAIKRIKEMGCGHLVNSAMEKREELKKVIGIEPEVYFADMRYDFIEDILRIVLVKGKEVWSFSDMLDEVLTHRLFGIPIFLALMWAAFQFTFSVAAPFSDAIDIGFSWLSSYAQTNISNPWISSLIAQGIIGGVGNVLIFLPNIFLLFFVLSLMEDSGYLSRAAFIMDKSMYKVGLQGKSFVPLLLGFGCNVPAIMATRTIEDPKDRLVTILVNPLMSCSARLPVYVLFAGAFFVGMQGTVIFSMYVMGILLAILMALLFRRFLVKGRPAPLIMEMPPYRMPTLKSSAMKMWENGSLFVKKAGTVILLGVVIIWFLSTYPHGPSGDIGDSYMAIIGHWIQPIFAPLGWDWKAAVALMFGFVAKEIVVATYGALYGISGANEESMALRSQLQGAFTPVSAYAFMAFVLIYVPCLATIATIKSETGSWKWALFAIGYMMSLAYAVALIITVAGHLLGLG
jgi:ferrous iron transport protein B